MTERIDLKALKEAAARVVAAGGNGLEASAAIDEFDYLCNAETTLRLVAVVEAALRMQAASVGVMDRDSVESGLEFYEADKALTASLHPFTEST
jgi:hypothetical protein